MQTKHLLVQLVVLSFLFVATHALVVTQNTQNAEHAEDMEGLDMEDSEGLDMELMATIQAVYDISARTAQNATDEKDTLRRQALVEALRGVIPAELLLEAAASPDKITHRSGGKIEQRTSECYWRCTRYWACKVASLFLKRCHYPKGCRCR